MKITRGIKKGVLAICLIFSLNIFSQSNRKFTIILDAGHGGKDPGNSHHGFVEKEIALKTTLKLEKLLQKDPDVRLICTRKTDIFVELADRPKIANSIDADLFVSVHCNSVKKADSFGTETFVMGLTRSDANFEIAKNENSVILLEKNYKETYRGFDPKKPETLIGLKILQEEYLNRSINLASKIENNFTNKLNRKSRGIKQSPLWVLDAAYMPSVLVELGFLSNSLEGLYLNSEEGQNNMAGAIADAIISYKKEYFGAKADRNGVERPVGPVVENRKKDTSKVAKTEPIIGKQWVKEQGEKGETSGLVFKVQIAASKKIIELTPANFNGLKKVSIITDGGTLYKYVYSSTSDCNVAKRNLEVARSKGHTSAFLIAFRNGKKISMQQALK